MAGHGHPDPGGTRRSRLRPHLRRPRPGRPSPPGDEARPAMKGERIAPGRIDWRQVAEVDHPSESPGYLLWRVSAAWQRRIRAALKPYGITHAQFVLLTCLTWLQDRYEAPVTQVALAEQAGLDKVT